SNPDAVRRRICNFSPSSVLQCCFSDTRLQRVRQKLSQSFAGGLFHYGTSGIIFRGCETCFFRSPSRSTRPSFSKSLTSWRPACLGYARRPAQSGQRGVADGSGVSSLVCLAL